MYSSSEQLDWPHTVGPLDPESSLSPTDYPLSSFSPLPRLIPRSSTSVPHTDELLSPYSPLLPGSILPPSEQPSAAVSPHSCSPSPELLASLTFDPNDILSQVVTPPLAHSPAARSDPTARKRERITGLTQQQRATRKKEQHKLIDAQRRQREHVVVVKMQQLMDCNSNKRPKRQRSDTNSTASTASHSDSELSSDEREEEYEEPTRRTVDKSDRVSVLERAAEHMERMQAALQQMAAACTEQQQQFRAFIERQQQLCSAATTCTCNSANGRACSCCPPHPLSSLHPLLTQRLHTQANTGALDSCTYISASVAMMVVSLTTGSILDVNSRFLSSGGWERHHLVDRNMLAPYATQAAGGPADTSAKVGFLNDRFLVDGPDGRMVPAPLYEQYERSKQVLKQLVMGEREMVTAVWRTSLKDGKLCELESTAWAGGHVEVEDKATGRRVKRPAYLVFVTGIDSRVCTDEDGSAVR